jgi:hypothetical protein
MRATRRSAEICAWMIGMDHNDRVIHIYDWQARPFRIIITNYYEHSSQRGGR